MDTSTHSSSSTADRETATTTDATSVAGYRETLRADRAEAALADAERKLARILQMVDAWEARFPQGVNTAMAAESIRMTIRPHA